jgi:hypothetical protein
VLLESVALNTESLQPEPERHWSTRLLTSPWIYVAACVVILLLDLVTSPFLLFPILYVVPVSLSAWFYSARIAYTIAVILPVGRFLISMIVDQLHPLPFMIANGSIRVVVLLFVAYLVARTARQTKELQRRVSGLVTMCAWSRTIEYKGEWISFEEYLKRRFNIDVTHGISPVEAEKAHRRIDRDDRR